jgi:CubicO group peptidase (beta-lactamase class C family)
MPAGGLFSTGADVARFCRMFLNLGELDGRRYLSEHAVADMTRKQTDESVPETIGLGWMLGEGSYGHGGALRSNMMFYPSRDRATIFLVQHEKFAGNGSEAHGAFEKAALAE